MRRPLALLTALVAATVSASAQPVVVPLDRALALARERSAEVLQAAADAQGARARLAEARDARWPSLAVGAGAGQRYGLAFDQTTGDLTQATVEALDVGVSAQVVVYDGGARGLEARAAGAAVEAAQASGARARQLAAVATVRGYLVAAQARAALAVAQAEVEAQTALLAQVEALVELGARPASETAQQRERLAAARGAVLDARRAQALAEAELVSLLGLDPAVDYAFPAPADSGADAEPADRLAVQAAASRPDVRAAQAGVSAARADIAAAQAARRPQVAVVAGAGTSFTSAAVGGLPGQLGDNRAGQLGLRVSLPVFDGGRTRGRVRQAQARAIAAGARADEVRRAAALEVRQAAIVLADLEAQADLADVRVAAAQTALDAEAARYQAGETTLQSVAQLRARAVDAATRQAVLAATARYQRLLLRLAAGDDV